MVLAPFTGDYRYYKTPDMAAYIATIREQIRNSAQQRTYSAPKMTRKYKP
jgi:hypothetical protein